MLGVDYIHPFPQDTSGTKNLGGVMNKEDFFKLLITQMQHQDPLNPMENEEFVSQLTGFSQLEQLYNTNENLEFLTLYEASINNSQAVNFLGKDVKAVGNGLILKDGEGAAIYYNLDKDAGSVTISIFDNYGKIVGNLNVGSQGKGENTVIWNGKDSEGKTMPEGEYTFKIAAKDINGNEITTLSYVTGVVNGITYEEGATYMIVNNRQIPVSDVLEINENLNKEE
ncbi:MAG: flagellar hook capping FlgD N-terminal domain-containing protein [Thermodesulfobacteriota bacterium]|nr:flagellar hook capping FlgD N-terminal domain-containing protein [Thermodesulfobacteriota bacterium]